MKKERSIKYSLIILFMFPLFFSCSTEKEGKRSRMEKLSGGVWSTVKSTKSVHPFYRNVRFSKNGQIFYLDSQGISIKNKHPKKFYIAGDTLKIVDYKYVPQLLFAKGTTLFLIEELSKHKLVLKMIHPASSPSIILENIR